MRLPNKFYVVVNLTIAVLLILSFLYLFIALLVKYGLFFDVKNYFAILIPIFGSAATIVLALLTFQMVREMKQTREEERRPYVYIDFLFDANIIFLVIKNTGRNGAKDIKFYFSESLISSDKRKISEIKLFKDGIDFLPPDKALKTWFDMAPSFYKSNLPTSYEVEVIYYDVISNRRYGEKFRLDLETYKGITYIDRKTIHHAVEQLKNINQTLRGIAGTGFLIETKKERDKKYREQKKYLDSLREQKGKDKDSKE